MSQFHIFLIIYLGASLYIFIRGWQVLPGNFIIYFLYSIVFLFLSFSLLAGILLRNHLEDNVYNNLRLVGSYWILFFVTFLAAAIFADLLRILDHLFSIFPAWLKNHYDLVKMIYSVSVLLIIIIICLCGFKTIKNPQIVNLDIEIKKPYKKVEDLKIIVASDMHGGYIIRAKHIVNWVELINKEDPDMVLLLGDTFDRFIDFNDVQPIEASLSKLRAKYGVYAILGNHDYYAGIDESIQSLKNTGITVLRDSVITINGQFLLAGRDDFVNRKRAKLDSILSGSDPRLFKILLDHSPTLNGTVENGVDLQLSGHLHNGQIFPMNIIHKMHWKIVYGYRKIEDTHIYVTSGLGLAYLPIRFGTRSEIVRINLHHNSDK